MADTYRDVAAILEALPDLVYACRRARRLSVRAAAAQIGCAPSTVNRVENGYPAALDVAVAMLRWLGADRG